MSKMILVNAVICKSCGDRVESKDVHDFRSCLCGKVSVDGGRSYIRRVGSPELMEDACVWDAQKFEGSLAGKYIIYIVEGRSNPSALFDRRQDAEEAASQMSFLGRVYVARIEEV